MLQWDDINRHHIARHGISVEEVEEVIDNAPLLQHREYREGEMRMLFLGATYDGRVLFVVLTPRTGVHRVVTAWPAKQRARKFYATQKVQRDAEEEGTS